MASRRLLYEGLVWSLTISLCSALKIAWLAPGSQSTNKINLDTSVAALKLALRSVAKTTTEAAGNVGVKFFDTDCTSQAATASMFAQRQYKPDVIIGPPCKEAMKSVAQLAGFWNIPLFGWYNPSNHFDDTKSYPTLIRMTPSVNIMAKTLVHILEQNGWRKFVLMHDTSEIGLEVRESVTREISSTVDKHIFSTKRLHPGLTQAQLTAMFTNIKKHASIIVFACPGNSVRRFLLAADKVGMTNGQYVFIQLDYKIYSGEALKNDVLSDRSWRRGDRNDRTARRAYETLIHIILDPMSDDGQKVVNHPSSRYEEFSKLALVGADMTKPEWILPGVSQHSNSLFPATSALVPDVHSLYLYDAVVIWSVLVDVVNRSGIDYKNGQLLAHMAKNFFADGATGYITINDNLDRVGKVFILDMAYDGNFKPVQVLRFNRTNGYTTTNLAPVKRMFRWSSGRKGIQQTPSDIPQTTTSTTTKTTTTTTRKPTTTTTTTTTSTTSTTTTTTTTTPAPTTKKPIPTTSKPDPMALIMNRLVALESFLKRTVEVESPPKPKPKVNAKKGNKFKKPVPKYRKTNRKGLAELKNRFAANAEGRQPNRAKNGNRARNGGRRQGKRGQISRDIEREPGSRGRKIRPTTNKPVTADGMLAYGGYDTTPANSAAQDFPSAMDTLFAVGTDMPTRNSPKRLNKNGPASKRRQNGNMRKGFRQRQNQQGRQHKGMFTNRGGMLDSNSLPPIKRVDLMANVFGQDQNLSDPLIDTISAKVAARITNSISKKLMSAKEKAQKNNDRNYAVNIIGDWIKPVSEDGMPRMNMTVQVNKTKNKNLKVTAQGMTVDNTISKKTINTAKNKTTAVTFEPPKQSEADKKTTAKPSNDLLTVTVAPHPMMQYPPWPYVYPTPMPPPWHSGGGENENQQPTYEPPMYPFRYPYPYPHAYPNNPPPQPQQTNQTVQYPHPPPGYPPYPMYPVYPGYHPQWSGQSGGEAR